MNPANLDPNNDRVIIRAVSRKHAYCCPQIFGEEIIADKPVWQNYKSEKNCENHS
jgi:hypothetical protein